MSAVFGLKKQLEGPFETAKRRKLYVVFKCIFINGFFFFIFTQKEDEKRCKAK